MGNDEFYLRHPRMPLERRAKIFIPFEPLRGLREELAARERAVAPMTELSDEQRFALSDELRSLGPGQRVRVKHYLHGTYVRSEGDVSRVRVQDALLELGGLAISFRDVVELERL
ncbi:hypothetical protein [Olsenella urininfantis]|uniref:hypothetical protein n=1 Tax=Olsenella urininfantis TaxID=1871033 RepID=UPI000984CC91|nr:hypothetical protein [Olsenella urininfantis]